MQLSDWQNVQVFDYNGSNQNFRQAKLQEINYNLENLQVNGVIAEFGTWKGFTINHIAESTDKPVYGFDSLIGLPEDWDMGEGGIHFKAKNWNFDNINLNSRINFYEGWFIDTIPQYKLDETLPFSYLNIDSDVYSSAKDILENLNDRIVPGTIIRFDELVCWRTEFGDESGNTGYLGNQPMPYYKNWRQGEWKALIEWLENYNRQVTPLTRTWHVSGSLIVNV